MFFAISAGCLAFVIFVTSAQSMSGLLGACGCGRKADDTAVLSVTARHSHATKQPGSPASTPAPPSTSVRWSVKAGVPPPTPSSRSTRSTLSGEKIRRGSLSVSTHHRAVEQRQRRTNHDRWAGKVCLFLFFFCVVILVVVFFSFHSIYKADFEAYGERNETLWRAACDANDVTILQPLGLS